ncbi:MAG: hypothetical protein Q8R06_13145 [Polaromonas sp.]|uniref:hypothetical protein n=1 Tax=Polaromonas sp. TaxID=1869339 RepID=UPI00273463A0|nr:hypothetical protein [Polaromonas sp.]MDP3798074.1 hypothetical protein [Polaromonas sp.]
MNNKSWRKTSAILLVALTVLSGSSWYLARPNVRSTNDEFSSVVPPKEPARADMVGERGAMLASPFGLQEQTAGPAGVTGRWIGGLDIGGGNRAQVSFNLRATDGQLTGTATFPVGEGSIEDGKITGNQLSFSTRHRLQSTGQILVTKFAGEMSEGTIALRMQTEGGESRLTINQVSR